MDILETNDLVENEVLITAALSHTYMFSWSYISLISERTVRWISKMSFKQGLSATSVSVTVLLLVTFKKKSVQLVLLVFLQDMYY